MTTLTISLPDSLTAFLQTQLAAKGLDASGYLGVLLQEAKAKAEDARLEQLLLEALDSEPIPLDQVFWDRVNARTEAILNKKTPAKPQ